MTSARWHQISSLYHATLERQASERETFLREACGQDEELRLEVEELLSHHGKAESFMEAPALDLAARNLSRVRRHKLVGGQLGPYEVLSLLGAGGMGEVYLARDSRLERRVALKVLPPEVAQDPDRLHRFVIEAKAASALNHPNITTTYEVGESGGIQWIAMEYVEGRTLEHRSGVMGEPILQIDEILNIGTQVADALDEAHRKGITHQDIKPANLMLTPRWQVKVLDFGLAKRPHQLEKVAGAEPPTIPGLVMGTVDYMSPEQVLGQEVNCRTDLFSLGVVLYDLVTGRLPFPGITPTDTIGKILHAQHWRLRGVENAGRRWRIHAVDQKGRNQSNAVSGW